MTMCGQSTRVDNRINTTNLDLSTVDTKESINTSKTGKCQRGNSVLELHVIVWQRLIAKLELGLIIAKGPCLCKISRNISLTAFSKSEEQSRHAEMTVLGIRGRHGGKELRRASSGQRHGVQVWTTISKGCTHMSLCVCRAPGCGVTTKEYQTRKAVRREGCKESRDA